MNYLAHFYLADDHAEAKVGALMGDFVKGQVAHDLPPVLRDAILQHRRIDVFTDRHPVFRRSRQRLRPEFRRYAGILVDVFYDHFLAVDWPSYSDDTLSAFARRIYSALDAHPTPLPGRMPQAVAWMIHNDSLTGYGKRSGILRTLKGLEARLSRPSRLSAAIVELDEHYEDLHHDFTEFFAALIDDVHGERNAPDT